MHNFYNVQGMTDLAVQREQANARLQPNNKWGPTPEESVIHFHRFTEDCSPLIQHEFYAVEPLTPKEVAVQFWKEFAYNTGGTGA